jgi:hypothetical protein
MGRQWPVCPHAHPSLCAAALARRQRAYHIYCATNARAGARTVTVNRAPPTPCIVPVPAPSGQRPAQGHPTAPPFGPDQSPRGLGSAPRHRHTMALAHRPHSSPRRRRATPWLRDNAACGGRFPPE